MVLKPNDISVFSTLSINGRLFVCPRDQLDSLVCKCPSEKNTHSDWPDWFPEVPLQAVHLLQLLLLMYFAHVIFCFKSTVARGYCCISTCYSCITAIVSIKTVLYFTWVLIVWWRMIYRQMQIILYIKCALYFRHPCQSRKGPPLAPWAALS